MSDLKAAKANAITPQANLNRRDALKKVVGLAGAAIVPGSMLAPAVVRAADTRKFKYKLAISLSDKHPIPIGLKAACADILRESDGRLDIQVFSNGQLGSDTDTIAQVRSGAIDFVSTAGLVWGTLVPVASINVAAFAFPDYQTVWNAMDGELGAHIRNAFAKVNLVPQAKIWDHGFRHVTTSGKGISVPQDLAGLKIRVPVSPMLTSLFKSLGAAPANINYGELYTALQTKIVDGQENPLAVVETAKLYEVQKSCSLTSHAWDGFWLCANKRSWEALPEDLRQLANRTFDAHAMKERVENAALNASLVESLKGRGMAFNSVDGKPFRANLQKAGYYAEWKQKLGPEAWAILEKYSGRLA
nr:TRAP transporter substrate-binding protein [uncultured Cupriavidus sp.]